MVNLFFEWNSRETWLILRGAFWKIFWCYFLIACTLHTQYDELSDKKGFQSKLVKFSLFYYYYIYPCYKYNLCKMISLSSFISITVRVIHLLMSMHLGGKSWDNWDMSDLVQVVVSSNRLISNAATSSNKGDHSLIDAQSPISITIMESSI